MARDKKLPRRAEIMGSQLLNRPLSSTRQLRSGTELSEDQAKRGVQDLKEAKLITSVYYGCRLSRVGHHYFMEEGLNHFGASDWQRKWHSQDAIGSLLVYDLPKVEAVHDIAPMFANGGWTMAGIQLYRREAMVAVAAYRHPDHHWPAYQVFCVPSMIDNQWELCSRLEQLPGELMAQALYPDKNFYPAGLSFVADDPWGADQVLGMASTLLSGWVPPANITAWYHSRDGWHVSDAESVLTGRAPTELSPLLQPLELLRAVANSRKLGTRRFDRIVDGCLWSGRGGQKLFSLLTLLGQYPVIAIAHLKVLAGEGREGEETERRLKALVRRGLAEIVAPSVRATARRLPRGVPLMVSERGQGAHHYALTKAGRLDFWYAHRGKPGALYTRSGLSAFDENPGQWSFRHQDGVYEVLAQFQEEGFAVAPGWRAHSRMANGTVIQPDGAVLLNTPWGRLWCFLEFELSDRSVMAFKPRCEKYGSEHRLESHPLLMVCHDDRAERNFWSAARNYAPDLRALTTTLARLREGGVLGYQVWRRWI